MKWLALMLLSGCICAPTPGDFRPAQPPYVVVCDEADSGVLECRAVEVIEI